MRFPLRTKARRPAVTRLSERIGLLSVGERPRVQQLTRGAWLVQDPSKPAARLRVDALDPNTWVLRRAKGRRRRIKQIGAQSLRTHLLVDNQAVRSTPRPFQRKLSDYLGHEQTAWVLRELGINCLLDVGANVGQFGTAIRRAGYGGRIVSFEPLPGCLDELRAHAAADGDWRVVDCAVGDEDGMAEINARPGTMSSMLPSSAFGKDWSRKLVESAPEKVQVRRLDGLLDEATAGIESPRVFLKLDTQGYDLQAFRGVGERVDEILGLQSELSCLPIYDGMPTMQEALAVYGSAGFELAGLYPVSFDHQSPRVIEFDAIMMRAPAAP